MTRSWDPFAPAEPEPAALTGVLTPPQDDAPATADTSEPAPAVTPLPDDLDDLHKPELVALAKQYGVDPIGYRRQLIARLRAKAG